MSLPAELSDGPSEPTFIEASRIQPAGHRNEGISPETQGVRSITILPASSRACVLCNGTVSFYTLPELSPAPNGREVHGCQWVGGLDLNQDWTSHDSHDLMVASAKGIKIVRISDKIQRLKSIQFPGCLGGVRRDTIACVADSEEYALLEVEHQQKIPLFPISSFEGPQTSSFGHVEDLPMNDTALPARDSSLPQHGSAAGSTSSHNRSSSLGNVTSDPVQGQLSPRADGSTRERLTSPNSLRRSHSPTLRPSEMGNGSLTSPRQSLSFQAASSPAAGPFAANGEPQADAILLKPHILSMTPSEFLLTTGTTQNEPGVGIFVNLDGDVVRGTIDFERYPETIVYDRSLQETTPSPSQEQVAGSLCVKMRRGGSDGFRKGIQVLSFASDTGNMLKSRNWIHLPEARLHVDLQGTASAITHNFGQVADLLKLVRIHIPERNGPGEGSTSKHTLINSSPPEWESKREMEEALFARNFAKATSQVIVWSDNNVFCLSANPLILQLEAQLHAVDDVAYEGVVTEIFQNLRNRDAQTETDFLSINYIRQKATLMMFTKVLSNDTADSTTAVMRLTENMLIESNLDPRILMMLLPMVNQEVLQGTQGIWLSAGLADLVEEVLESGKKATEDIPMELWQMVKRYMVIWQGKRGFGSISDEQYVFDSVDAALLRVLLHLEESLPHGSPSASSIRTKLYNVVDNWKGDFNRAVALLEEYRRLFVLSRLYQSRRMARDVLATWKRVVDGEVDGVGELDSKSAAMQMRRYLVNIRDAELVQEYALWLAQKNPDLAVEVFADDKSRVSLAPPQVLQLLQKDAPGAVQNYLEYLVFKKGSTKYADDLIGYYLDSVLSVLESSETARDSVAQSYATYRALEPPKPTYLSFIHENAPPEPWWRSRLRLLQLLGGGHYASAPMSAASELAYSIPTVLARLAPFSSYLVSESIILDARQGRHRQALGLLTHGLGDYDTAVRYCYFGGPQPTISVAVDESQIPTFEAQKDLFDALLDEFLSIEDLSTRLERSSELLAKFAKWYDPATVLDKIPAGWSLDVLAEFLLRTLRALNDEKLEVGVVKALSAAENLRKQVELMEVCEKMGARIQAEQGSAIGDNSEAAEARAGAVGPDA